MNSDHTTESLASIEGASADMMQRGLEASNYAAQARTGPLAPPNGQRIMSDPHILGGTWRIGGTRIPAATIKRFHEDGFSVEAIIGQYPDLTPQDVNAALAFVEPTPKSSHPTQADLESIIADQTPKDFEAPWDDPEELAIQALVHRAFMMELVRKGWSPDMISSAHMKCLRIAQAAIRAVERREVL